MVSSPGPASTVRMTKNKGPFLSLTRSGMTVENLKHYKIVFLVGSCWNFVTSIGVFILMGSLPAFIGIPQPRYPVFIYFNLLSVFFFGCIQWTIAIHLDSSRSFVKILMWSKLVMGIVFTYAMFTGPFSKELFSFLVPGMVIDVIFGLIYWRFLVFSRHDSSFSYFADKISLTS